MSAFLDQLSKTSAGPGGHSATVCMRLYQTGESFPVLQSGPTALKLPAGVQVSLDDAILEITVDGRPHRRNIRILNPTDQPNWFAIVNL